jgi:2-amino-4-hydroxy-6-hydroxymethyldihydropteridine diphosphokinase
VHETVRRDLPGRAYERGGGIVTEPIIIGMGGNIGEHDAIVERFDRARAALGVLGTLRSAPLYRTAPLGPAQPAFLNSAVRLFTDGTPAELIATTQEIERLLGRRRDREARWGPRTLDLDVLIWGARLVCTPELEVPHPRLGERKFALAPLVDLVGDSFSVPGLGAAGQLLARVAHQHCERIAESW